MSLQFWEIRFCENDKSKLKNRFLFRRTILCFSRSRIHSSEFRANVDPRAINFPHLSPTFASVALVTRSYLTRYAPCHLHTLRPEAMRPGEDVCRFRSRFDLHFQHGRGSVLPSRWRMRGIDADNEKKPRESLTCLLQGGEYKFNYEIYNFRSRQHISTMLDKK